MPTARPTTTLDFSGGLQPDFLRRVLLASVIVSLVGGLLAATRWDNAWGLGFAVFGLWATANIWALRRVLGFLTEPDRGTLQLVAALALKIPVLYGVGFLLLWRGGFPPVSVVAGISVPLAVIFLKILGRVIAPRVAVPTPKSR